MGIQESHSEALTASSKATAEATIMELSPNETITSALLSKVADLETRVLSPEKKYRDERRARITLETSFRTVKAKSKQWAGAMGVRLRMLENRGKPVLTLLNTQREERRIHKSKRKKMKAAIKGLKNKVMKLEAANIDDEDKTHAVVGMKSGAKRIKNIIREQGRHYRMISELRQKLGADKAIDSTQNNDAKGSAARA